MFALFKKSQKTNVFDIQYKDFVNEYKKVLNQFTNVEIEDSNKNFIEITDNQIVEFQELIYHMDALNDRVSSKLIPITAENEIEKITLQNAIAKSQNQLLKHIELLFIVKDAYIQGLQDSYNLEKD